MSRGGIVLRFLGALLASAVCVVGVFVLAHAAVGTPRGQRLDQLVLTAARNDSGVMAKIVFPVLNTVTVPVIIAAIVLAAVLALVQRRPSTIVHVVVLVGGAALSTQVLKQVIVDRSVLAEGLDITPNSYPSGHTTMAAAVAVALTLAAPRSVRSLVAILGAAWTAIAGIGTIAGGWHRPSDVLGGLLVVGAWSYLVLAADAVLALVRAGRLARAEHARPARHTRRPAPGIDDAAAADAGTGTGTGTDSDTDTDPTDVEDPLSDGPRRDGAGLFAVGLLGAVAILGAGLGMLCLAAVPTPLELGDQESRDISYAATVLIVSGAASALLCWVVAVHLPRSLSPALSPSLSQGVPTRRVR